MNYSKHHTWFADDLTEYYSINEQDVLDFPENYLGPNYKEVLNFWFYKDSLTRERLDIYSKSYWEIDRQTRKESRKIAIETASEVIDTRFVDYLWAVECEIIAAHLYLERNIPFTFLPLFFVI
jgi:hypothetical protein